MSFPRKRESILMFVLYNFLSLLKEWNIQQNSQAVENTDTYLLERGIRAYPWLCLSA